MQMTWLCGVSEEVLRGIVGWFAEVCRKGLKVNSGKNKVMVLNGEDGLECEVHVDRIRLEHVSEFTDGEEYSRKVSSGRRVAGVIKSLDNAIYLQFECTLFVLVLMDGRDTILWK